MAAWAFVSLAERPPLDNALAAAARRLAARARGDRCALYGLPPSGSPVSTVGAVRFVVAFMLAFALLAEAMVVIAWGATGSSPGGNGTC
jgi:hypothetical protein